MNGYMTCIGRTKDIDSKKVSESPNTLPRTSDPLKHKRQMPDGLELSMEDMRIHYCTDQTVIQMFPIHSSFKTRSYRWAARSIILGRGARALCDRGMRDSVVLRTALVEDSGVPDSRIEGSSRRIHYRINNQAHHIVETNNWAGRWILFNADIHWNSAANGVLLPVAEGDATGNAAIHNGSHCREYRDCINAALTRATEGREPHSAEYTAAVIAVLGQIRRLLLNHNVALNKRGDADYVDERPQGKSIRDYFRDQELI